MMQTRLSAPYIVALAVIGATVFAADTCSESDVGSGGYSASVDAERELLSPGGDACDIPRLSSLSVADFNATYRLRRPFVLTGVVQPRQRANFTKAALLRAYGDVRVRAGIAREIIRRSGSGYRGMALRHFVDAMKAADTVGERGDAL